MDDQSVSSSCHWMGGGDGTNRGRIQSDPAFDSFYRRFHTRLSRYAFRMLGDSAAAEDVAQESLVRAWQCHDHFASDDQIVPWLWRVARNLCVDVTRARRRVVSIEAIDDHPDPAHDISIPVETEEERRHVRDTFGRLNERHREILYLREVEGVRYEELAVRLGVSEQGARQVVSRARRGLRHALESVIGGTLATLLWVRTKVVARLDSMHPVANLAMNTVLVAALSTGAALGTGAVDPRIAGDVSRIARELNPTRDAGVAVRANEADETPQTRAPLHIRIDRKNGSADIRASVPMGGGREEQVWAKLWRRERERPSHLLSGTDTLGERACDVEAAACEHVDDALDEPLGGP